MSDAHGDESPHQRPHPQPMAAPFLEFDLVRELEQLHCELPTSGQSAKTLAAAVASDSGRRHPRSVRQ
jgi:hypothetical protein